MRTFSPLAFLSALTLLLPAQSQAQEVQPPVDEVLRSYLNIRTVAGSEAMPAGTTGWYFVLFYFVDGVEVGRKKLMLQTGPGNEMVHTELLIQRAEGKFKSATFNGGSVDKAGHYTMMSDADVTKSFPYWEKLDGPSSVSTKAIAQYAGFDILSTMESFENASKGLHAPRPLGIGRKYVLAVGVKFFTDNTVLEEEYSGDAKPDTQPSAKPDKPPQQ